MFRGRPYEIPKGTTTALAKATARAELQEAVIDLTVRTRQKRYEAAARINGYRSNQLKYAARGWIRVGIHRLKIVKMEAVRRTITEGNAHLDEPKSRNLRKRLLQHKCEFSNRRR